MIAKKTKHIPVVIPGKLAKLARPGIQGFQKRLDTGWSLS
jgi:hypothetical protein